MGASVKQVDLPLWPANDERDAIEETGLHNTATLGRLLLGGIYGWCVRARSAYEFVERGNYVLIFLEKED